MDRGLFRCHPWVGFLYIAILFTLSFTVTDLVFTALSFCAALSFKLSVSSKNTVKLLLGLIFTGAFIVLFNLYFGAQNSELLFYFLGKRITLLALKEGIRLALTFMAVILWSMSLMPILSYKRLGYILGRPFKNTRIALGISLSMIKRITRRIQLIYNLNSKNQKIISRSGGAIIHAILWSAEDSADLSKTMTDRGFYTKHYTPYHTYSFGIGDFIVITLLFAATSGVLLSVLIGGTQTPQRWSTGVVLFLPIILLIKEELYWRSYPQKN